ncbi:hypothetical protein BLD44_005800 [Mastigocladus laminosus UU774]|nr:hypothetical protein BLD44_005800 [Mastigocladus laminosus UU774]
MIDSPLFFTLHCRRVSRLVIEYQTLVSSIKDSSLSIEESSSVSRSRRRVSKTRREYQRLVVSIKDSSSVSKTRRQYQDRQ